MSNQKTFDPRPNYSAIAIVSAALVLALFASIFVIVSDLQGAECQERVHGAYTNAEGSEHWAIHRNTDGSYSATKSAANDCQISDERWLVFWTFALFAATAALFGATYALWRTTLRALRDASATALRQSDQFEKQLAVARSTADANLQSVDSLKRSERAYILPVIYRMAHGQLLAQMDGMVDRARDHPGRLEVGLALKNFGRTPGLVIDTRAELYFADRKPDQFTCRIMSNPLLGSNESTEYVQIMLEPVFPGEAASVRFGDMTLILGGFVEFEDMFRERVREEFEWIYDHKQSAFIPRLFPRVVLPARKT